jgi:hypothetical protein
VGDNAGTRAMLKRACFRDLLRLSIIIDAIPPLHIAEESRYSTELCEIAIETGSWNLARSHMRLQVQ